MYVRIVPDWPERGLSDASRLTGLRALQLAVGLGWPPLDLGPLASLVRAARVLLRLARCCVLRVAGVAAGAPARALLRLEDREG